MPCRFSNDLLALYKCRILRIENLTSNRKNLRYQAFNEHSADKLIAAYIFEILNKKLGSVM